MATRRRRTTTTPPMSCSAFGANAFAQAAPGAAAHIYMYPLSKSCREAPRLTPRTLSRRSRTRRRALWYLSISSMNAIKHVERINAKDLQLQLASDTVGNAGVWNVNKSWHAQYKDSAYVYIGGLSDGLSEGDVIVIASQFGEVVDINMPRDKKTGKTKGFAFICYEVRCAAA